MNPVDTPTTWPTMDVTKIEKALRVKKTRAPEINRDRSTVPRLRNLVVVRVDPVVSDAISIT